MTRVLVTGAGGPAGVSIIRSLLHRSDVTVAAADMDRYASGLYLVEAAERRLVLAGLAPEFTDDLLKLCVSQKIDVLFPTVDVELEVIAARRAEFADNGVKIASPSAETLEVCLDKYALAARCQGIIPVPTTALLGAESTAIDWDFPVMIKPRRGAGSRGIRQIDTREELEALGSDDQTLVQELLPGEEFSVDVLSDLQGSVIAAVPRSRLRVDSGVSVAGATKRNDELENAARAVAAAIGLTTVGNVQLRRNVNGMAALLEVNPRFPGAMPLTIAAGVDMPSLTLDLVLGNAVPANVDFRELSVVRYLEDVFLDTSEIMEPRT